MRVPIHYDMALGANPWWRKALTETLAGRTATLLSDLQVFSKIGESGPRMISAVLAYALGGQQVFHVGPVMQELFDECLLTEVPGSHIDLPYECFYIALPDCLWPIWGGDRTQIHPISGLYVQRHRDILSLLVWGQANQRSLTVDDDATFWCDIDLGEVPQVVQEGITFYDLEAYFPVLMHPYRGAHDLGLGLPTGENLRIVTNSVLHLWRIVFNLLLYLNSDRPDVQPDNEAGNARRQLSGKLDRVKSKGKAAKLQRMLARLTEASITWVGQDIERRAKATQTEPTSRTVRLHRRRGHRHSYWTGPRKDAEGNPRLGDQVIVKFIAPTWVGGSQPEPTPEELKQYPGRRYRLDIEKGEA